MSHVSKAENSSDINWTPGIGAQASVGVQVTENIGLDLSYTMMTQKGEADAAGFGKAEIEFKIQGVEIGLHATF
jgi:hypothetical protein